jgi:hypothetical protein
MSAVGREADYCECQLMCNDEIVSILPSENMAFWYKIDFRDGWFISPAAFIPGEQAPNALCLEGQVRNAQ